MRTVLMMALLTLPLSAAAQPDSIAVLTEHLTQDRKDGDAWLQLGRLYGARDQLDDAQDAFHHAIDLAPTADAYHELGRLYLRRCTEKHQPVYCLRVEPNLEKALDADSTFAPAYLSLAEWYRDSGFDDRMADLLSRYAELRPSDADGRYALALTHNEHLAFDRVLTIARAAVKDFPDDSRWLPLVAQAYAARGDAEWALKLFDRYFQAISDRERALYQDLSLIARPGEMDGFSELSALDQRGFLDDFWRRRDPTLVSGGRARRAEHYRRVWYARNYFSDRRTPWDRRGDVYIRYGEPTYRSRSDRTNTIPPPLVQMIKERNRLEIYGEDWDSWIQETRNDPEAGSPGLGNAELESIHGITVADETGIGPAFPVRSGPAGATTPWESWVYTQVGGGIEIVFTDETGGSGFDYAPVPPVDLQSDILGDLAFRATTYAPGQVVQRVTGSQPDRFTLPPGVEPLEFYYDVAAFRGEDTSADERVDVYFGIPPEQLAGKTKRERVILDRTVVLADSSGTAKHCLHDRLGFSGVQRLAARKGAFIPELATARISPGDYRLAIQLSDPSTGKWGIYLQDITVPSYRDSLALSDIALAWTVSSDGPEDKFTRGEVRVIPMASRTYRTDQSVFLYYEIYNLRKDGYGQTRYEVAYTIKRDVRRAPTLFGGLAKLFDTLFSNRKPQFSVSYERSGNTVNEPIYLELDTERIEPGLNQVQVSVRDLVAGRDVSKTALFRMDRSDGKPARVESALEDLEKMDIPEHGRPRRRRR